MLADGAFADVVVRKLIERHQYEGMECHRGQDAYIQCCAYGGDSFGERAIAQVCQSFEGDEEGMA